AMDPLLADAPDNTPIVLLNPAGPATRVARALARRLPGRRVWSATGYSDLTTTSTSTDAGSGTGAGVGTDADADASVLRIVLVDRTDVPASMRPPLGQWTLEHRPPVIPDTPRPGLPSPSPAEQHHISHTNTPMDAHADGEGEADIRVLFPGLSPSTVSPDTDDGSMPDDEYNNFLNSLGGLPDPEDDTLRDSPAITLGTSALPPDPDIMAAPPPGHRDAGTEDGFNAEDWMDLDGLGTDDESWDSPGITFFTDLMDLDSDLTGAQGVWDGFAVTENQTVTNTETGSGTTGIPTLGAGRVPPDPGFMTDPPSGTASQSTNPHPHNPPPAHPDDHAPTAAIRHTDTDTEGRQAPPVFTATSASTGLFDGEPVTLGRLGRGPAGFLDSLLQALHAATPHTLGTTDIISPHALGRWLTDRLTDQDIPQDALTHLPRDTTFTTTELADAGFQLTQGQWAQAQLMADQLPISDLPPSPAALFRLTLRHPQLWHPLAPEHIEWALAAVTARELHLQIVLARPGTHGLDLGTPTACTVRIIRLTGQDDTPHYRPALPAASPGHMQRD
ncbi:hypothetical protein ACIP10_36475, partial [Streptomyces galbus]|uniref:hypothetical protein n=1 Tax=Streptomyces galbus TaxID=33898 RepID=UPI00380F4F95